MAAHIASKKSSGQSSSVTALPEDISPSGAIRSRPERHRSRRPSRPRPRAVAATREGECGNAGPSSKAELRRISNFAPRPLPAGVVGPPRRASCRRGPRTDGKFEIRPRRPRHAALQRLHALPQHLGARRAVSEARSVAALRVAARPGAGAEPLPALPEVARARFRPRLASSAESAAVSRSVGRKAWARHARRRRRSGASAAPPPPRGRGRCGRGRPRRSRPDSASAAPKPPTSVSLSASTPGTTRRGGGGAARRGPAAAAAATSPE